MLVNLSEGEAGQHSPIPADFAPALSDNGKVLSWEQRVSVGADTLALHAGLRYGAKPFHTREEAARIVRATAWQLLECARLGWAHKLSAFRRDRHAAKHRPVSVPGLPDPQVKTDAG